MASRTPDVARGGTLFLLHSVKQLSAQTQELPLGLLRLELRRQEPALGLDELLLHLAELDTGDGARLKLLQRHVYVGLHGVAILLRHGRDDFALLPAAHEEAHALLRQRQLQGLRHVEGRDAGGHAEKDATRSNDSGAMSAACSGRSPPSSLQGPNAPSPGTSSFLPAQRELMVHDASKTAAAFSSSTGPITPTSRLPCASTSRHDRWSWSPMSPFIS